MHARGKDCWLKEALQKIELWFTVYVLSFHWVKFSTRSLFTCGEGLSMDCRRRVFQDLCGTEVY